MKRERKIIDSRDSEQDITEHKARNDTEQNSAEQHGIANITAKIKFRTEHLTGLGIEYNAGCAPSQSRQTSQPHTNSQSQSTARPQHNHSTTTAQPQHNHSTTTALHVLQTTWIGCPYQTISLQWQSHYLTMGDPWICAGPTNHVDGLPVVKLLVCGTSLIIWDWHGSS